MADETNPYDLGFTGSPGGLYVLPGEGYGVRAETGLTVPDDTTAVDPITGAPVDTQPGTPGIGWGGWSSQDKNWLDTIKNLFGGTGAGGQLGQLAAFGGLAMLLNKMMGQQSQQPVGYQGGIPQYTASRTQYNTGLSTDTARLKQAVNDSLAQGFTMDQIRQGALQKFGISPSQISEAVASPAGAYRRPGQGGITYFSPVQYTKSPVTVTDPTSVTPTAPAQSKSTAPFSADIRPEYDEFRQLPQVPSRELAAASGGHMRGGIAMLAGGRYLRGSGDGVSDSIPARFSGSGQEARLADGEFVIPARVVSEIGNGSSDAGARKLYAMLDRVEARAKKSKRGKPSGADRELNKLA